MKQNDNLVKLAKITNTAASFLIFLAGLMLIFSTASPFSLTLPSASCVPCWQGFWPSCRSAFCRHFRCC